MKSLMTDLAKQQIRQIAKYIRMEFGKHHGDKFIQEVRHTRRLIESNPSVGIVEPLLAERAVMVRRRGSTQEPGGIRLVSDNKKENK